MSRSIFWLSLEQLWAAKHCIPVPRTRSDCSESGASWLGCLLLLTSLLVPVRGSLTSGNTDDRKLVAEMSKELFGKLIGDRGYFAQALFEQLLAQSFQLIDRLRTNMTNTLMTLLDKILLRKRSRIETVNDQLTSIC